MNDVSVTLFFITLPRKLWYSTYIIEYSFYDGETHHTSKLQWLFQKVYGNRIS